jgi:peptide deformylase
MNILRYGNDLLTHPSAPVQQIDDNILTIISDMKECLKNTPGGIGLAAPQVGILLQISVIDLSILDEFSESDRYTLINPKIIEHHGITSESEGCLSFPNITTFIKRHEQIKVSYINPDNHKKFVELDGFAARAFQHEIDHLNGVLIIDRVSSLKKRILKREIQKLKKLNEW